MSTTPQGRPATYPRPVIKSRQGRVERARTTVIGSSPTRARTSVTGASSLNRARSLPGVTARQYR